MSEENTQEAVTLQVQDIVMAANIIDLATQRGAFKAAEASQVGANFQKLVAFVRANTPQEETDEAETTEASTEE